jgi:hypothetical protein
MKTGTHVRGVALAELKGTSRLCDRIPSVGEPDPIEPWIVDTEYRVREVQSA